MQPLIWDRRPDGLRAPAMVCAFQGWNDAGDAASSAVSFFASALEARRFARIDSEEFYDFQANRPCIRLDDGNEREVVWPTVEVFEAPAPRAPRDLVLVQGVEPSMRWRAFSSHIVDLAEALGVQMVVSLGALLGDVPHTRPVAMTGYASDPALVERLGMQTSSYEGPTGIVGILHSACADAGLPSASLWAAVPHYVAAAANPKAALALVRRVEGLIGVSVDVSELESAAADYERQVGLAVQSDPDIQAFVERLEQAAESEDEQSTPVDVPSGDMLAREFQRFLRQRGRESK
jgi:predicted ATP-grasp superfamily ATP-dependent carboligase